MNSLKLSKCSTLEHVYEIEPKAATLNINMPKEGKKTLH